MSPPLQRNLMRAVTGSELQESAVYQWLTVFLSGFAHAVRELVMDEQVIVTMSPREHGTPELIFNQNHARYFVPNME